MSHRRLDEREKKNNDHISASAHVYSTFFLRTAATLKRHNAKSDFTDQIMWDVDSVFLFQLSIKKKCLSRRVSARDGGQTELPAFKLTVMRMMKMMVMMMTSWTTCCLSLLEISSLISIIINFTQQWITLCNHYEMTDMICHWRIFKNTCVLVAYVLFRIFISLTL